MKRNKLVFIKKKNWGVFAFFIFFQEIAWSHIFAYTYTPNTHTSMHIYACAQHSYDICMHTLKLTYLCVSIYLLPMQPKQGFVKGKEKVNFPDLCEFLGRCKQKGNPQMEVLDAFRTCDSHKTGEIDVDLLKCVLYSTTYFFVSKT